MTDHKLFHPDEAMVFRKLPDQFRIIGDMGRIFRRLCAKGIASRDAFYFAYTETHKNQYGISTAVGAREFYRRMTEYLRIAMNIVERMVDTHFRPFDERLAAHNQIANLLDPIQMFKIATTNPGSHSPSLVRRRHFEALRQFGIALQLFSIESVDEESWVAEDLTVIDRLARERLFTTGEDIRIWAVAELDPAQNFRAKSVELFQRQRKASGAWKKLRRQGIPYEELLLECRVVDVGRKRIYVHLINRRKRLDSTLLKLERGRPATDRRGWKYVVVGARTGNSIRLATRRDADDFLEYTRKVLWTEPLIPLEDKSKPNPHSHPTYWDRKIIGRYLRPDNGRIIAGPAEQLVTTISDHMDVTCAIDQLNHTLYKHEQVFDAIGPLWFPHARGPFHNIASVRLPHYGVNWDAPAVRGELQRWWKHHLKHAP